MTPDFDYCELYVKVLNYFTGKVYVDTVVGSSSNNIPIESCELTDVMYEPKASQMTTAKIIFPTISQNPSLRPLLEQIKEGDRVEVYHFQPDCGLPVFAGFIPPGGITVEAGRMVLDLQDVLGRGQWERIRPYEDFDTNADGYYTRAMHRWQDYLNEDFNIATAVHGATSYDNMYALSAGDSSFIQQGIWSLGPAFPTHIFETSAGGSPTITLQPGVKVLIEARGTSQTDFLNSTPSSAMTLNNRIGLTNGVDTLYFEEFYATATGSVGGNVTHVQGVTANSQTSPNNYTAANFGAFQPGTIGQPANHLYAILIEVQDDFSVVVSAFVDYTQITPPVVTPIGSQTGWYFFLHTIIPSLDINTLQNWYSFRVRYLTPWLTRAATFLPQTTEATEFQANNDDLYTFLNNFVEIDFAEYRPIYQPYPTIDQLELNGIGLLGINASQRLGIDEFMDGSAPRIQQAGGTEIGDFLYAPAFRFEEGWNMSGYPSLQKSQLNHSNDVVRMGSGNTDGQTFYDRWNTGEVGNPFGNFFSEITGAAPTYPYFEALINDDRTSLTNVISTLASNDLSVRKAPVTPSLQVNVAEDIRYAFKWRAGDFARVKTQSLIPNVDQDMRIMSVRHTSGKPEREIVVGRLPYDPQLRTLIARSMVESWLYTQSGAGQLVLVYPFVPVTLTTGQQFTSFQVPLNQFTSGSAITYAALRWSTNGSDQVGNIEIAFGGDYALASPTFIPTNASGQDSGLIPITGHIPGPGVYYIAPKNISGGNITLNTLFVILKMKV